MQSFRPEAGEIVGAVTADQMRELDRVAIEETGPNLFQMMENAGRNLASLSVKMLGEEWPAAPVVIVAGTGGNGGGGICAGRHLTNRGGHVTLVVSDADRLSGVPAQQLSLFLASGGRVASSDALGALEPALTVDALLGYGLTGAPRGKAAELIRWMARGESPVLSLDVPSGVDATTGDTPGDHVRAIATMTLALPKTGLGVGAVGDLWLADIGIPRGVVERAGILPLPAGVFSRGSRVRLR